MPDAPSVRAAAIMLWILDASINVSMEPFRAFVADKLPLSQRTMGFVMQSFFIGLGATAANELPDLLQKFGVTGNAANGVMFTSLGDARKQPEAAQLVENARLVQAEEAGRRYQQELGIAASIQQRLLAVAPRQ